MAKRQDKKNNKIPQQNNIFSYFSTPKRRRKDPENESGDTQLQEEESNNQIKQRSGSVTETEIGVNIKTETRAAMKKQERTLKEEDLSLGGASLKEPEIKSEDAPKSEGHLHKFLLINKKYEKKKNTIQCDHPQTVLQAIKSKSKQTVKCDVNKIILQIGEGKEAAGTAIATHYPCTLLKDGELVTLKETKQLVEVRKREGDYRVDLNERYHVVYIKTVGGTRSKTKNLFRSGLMKSFSQLCVYGTGNMTLKDAIERDGRFVELSDYELEDVTQPNVYVSSNDRMQQYHEKTFWIRVNNRNDVDRAGLSETDEAASKGAGDSVDTGEAGPSSAGEAAALKPVSKPGWESVGEVLKRKQAAGFSAEVKQIYKLLRAQFPELKEQLLSRISAETLKNTLKKVDFGKAQQTFSEIGRVRELFEMGDSVCKITVGNVCEGTGFVLFKRYVLTNAHLFKKVMYNNSMRTDIVITAMFNYEKQNQTNTINFNVRNTFIDYDKNMDYAVLELVVSEKDESLVPPGLMKHCCPMPESGEACIIGHPNGEVKQFDPTCIIEKENRKNEVNKHLLLYDGSMFTLMSVEQIIKNQGIERIVSPSGQIHKQTASYRTFMYHGSSGSPVFDAHCRVFGLHTAGFTYGFGPKQESVIEFARSLLLIFQKFVTNLRTRNNTDLLRAVEEELKDNKYQMEILTGEEPMDES